MNSQRFALLSVLAVVLSLAACSREEAPAEPQAAAETNLDLATRAGAPLFDGMGNHNHPITTE